MFTTQRPPSEIRHRGVLAVIRAAASSALHARGCAPTRNAHPHWLAAPQKEKGVVQSPRSHAHGFSAGQGLLTVTTGGLHFDPARLRLLADRDDHAEYAVVIGGRDGGAVDTLADAELAQIAAGGPLLG